jgi:hypothetical protein
MFLKDFYFNTPESIENNTKTFFHEAGHALSYKLRLGYSGPSGSDRRKEWTKIS